MQQMYTEEYILYLNPQSPGPRFKKTYFKDVKQHLFVYLEQTGRIFCVRQ